MSLARVEKGQPNPETLSSARCPTPGSTEGGPPSRPTGPGSWEQWLAGETRGRDRRGRGGSPSTCRKAVHSGTRGPAPLELTTLSSRMPAAAAVSAASASADARGGRARAVSLRGQTDRPLAQRASRLPCPQRRGALPLLERPHPPRRRRGPESRAATKGKRRELGIKARDPRGEPQSLGPAREGRGADGPTTGHTGSRLSLSRREV